MTNLIDDFEVIEGILLMDSENEFALDAWRHGDVFDFIGRGNNRLASDNNFLAVELIHSRLFAILQAYKAPPPFYFDIS